jgi:Nucleoside-diphosphate-sugar epimerases
MENTQANKTVLVTGGTGFLGIHIILQLLHQDFNVKTTLRSLSKKDVIIKALQQGGIEDFSNLSFYEANLTEDKIGMKRLKTVIMYFT